MDKETRDVGRLNAGERFLLKKKQIRYGGGKGVGIRCIAQAEKDLKLRFGSHVSRLGPKDGLEEGKPVKGQKDSESTRGEKGSVCDKMGGP